jgi:hypothetical protein
MNRNNKPGRIVKGTAKTPTLKDASGVWTLDEAMQAHRANAWPQPNLFQPISNSLRIKNNNGSGSTLYQYKTRGGNQRTWTFSTWIKRSAFISQNSNDHEIFGGWSGTSYYSCHIIWSSQSPTDSLQVYDWGLTGGGSFSIQTGAVFRDINAWYHIVVAVDTTQATNTNRIKIYVNGVQLNPSTFTNPNSWNAGQSGFPSQGSTTLMNSPSGLHAIGTSYLPSDATGKRSDGYMSEVNFVDGYQLDPSLFGKFDTNNTWVPIPYTGSYGTNGFYLPFTNPTTSQTLGYDASLNGTPTYGSDQDPYRSSVVLHLTGNGPAGGQNNTFTDSSSNNLAITRQGTPTQGSFSPYPLNTNAPYNPSVNGASMFTSSSLSSNNFLTTAATSALEFGSGNFTIEFWWYPTSTTRQALYHASYGTDWSVGIDFNGTGVQSIGIWASSNGTNWNLLNADPGGNAVGTLIVNQNAWNHFAYVRNGTTWQSYLNGVLDKNLTGISGTIASRSGSGKAIGAWWNTTAMSTATGYLSNFRIITGQAIYTAAFTPTNRPFGTLTNNLITFSEDFANSGWGKDGGYSVTPNYAVAPDGTPSMTLVSRAAGSLGNWAALTWANFVGTGNNAGKTYTFSIWVQAVSGTVNGTLAISDVSYNTSVLSFTATTTPQRYSMSYNGPSGTWNASSAYIGGGLNLSSVGTSVLVWGAQLEVASSATNYTPTPANYSTAPALLLNFANAAVVDSAGAQTLLTASGATITSASKYGSGALTFNGTSDYLNGSTGYTFGSKDWTIEGWINSKSDGNVIRFNQYSIAILVSSGKLVFYITSNGSSWDIAAGLSFSSITMNGSNIWYHFALVRNRGAITPYLNGIAGTSCSIGSSAIGGDGGFLRVATEQTGFVGGFGGQLDDVCITMGVARYTSNFGAPVRALPETGGKSFVTTNVNAGVVKTFTTVGNTSWTAPSDVSQVEVLVVAGGGGSGGSGLRSGFVNNAAWGGGGGGGGLIYNSQYTVTPGQTYTVTVGAGGAVDNNGGNSVFGNLIAIGGGAGGDSSNGAVGDPGNTGGSGGGGGGDITTTPGSGTAGQGFAGGAGLDPSPESGGGGGGAGGAGQSGATATGGPGLQFGISGTPTYYAGGGGGGAGTQAKSGNTGGLGGGGNGTTNPYTGASNATAGTANTGGGGGGGPTAGGSGIVIVRYTTQAIANSSDATTDNLVDSPTLYGHDYGNGGEVVGNYATWNPLIGANMNTSAVIGSSVVVYTNGNLNASNPIAAGQAPRMQCHSNISMTTGKWYAEFTNITSRQVGISKGDYQTYSGTGVDSLVGYYSDGTISGNVNGSTFSYTGSGVALSATDVVGVAFDADAATLTWYVNGVSRVVATSIASTTRPTSPWFFSSNPNTSGATSSVTANFGQRPWAYTPPQGFNALTTKNLPRATLGTPAAAPNQYFDVVTYAGNSSSQTISTLNFQPDLIWIKSRSNSYSHWIGDSVRGFTVRLYSDGPAAEASNPNGGVTAVSSTGFTVSAGAETNNTSNNYVAWCWKKSAASGFDIQTYTSGGGADTVAHSLGVTPSMIIVKSRSSGSANWWVYHTGTGTGKSTSLNQTIAQVNDTWTVTSTNFTYNYGISNGQTAVAYLWAEVAGFSKFGSYAGNGNIDGPFVYCGFKPRFVMVKRIDTSEVWAIIDTARDTYNVSNKRLLPNSSAGENTGDPICMDVLSNGFKLRSTDTTSNALGSTYIFMAFAEKPFGNANGTAR